MQEPIDPGGPVSGRTALPTSFEAAMSELERIVVQLERGDVALDESIQLYERGAQLRQFCQDRLASAQLRVDQIIAADAGVRVEPAEIG